MYRKYFKTIFDRIFSLIFLIILSPLFIVIGFITWVDGFNSIFFIHERPGLNGQPFKLLKFKTMNEKRGSNGKLLPNKERITLWGSYMRRMSFDEIPQLINVIKGDISLVGPRPLEMRYLKYYTNEQKRRHNVKPGITGWAQINGRNTLSWEDKFRFDIWYVDNISFYLDLKILFITLVKVFKREGIDSDKSNTVVPFDVNLKSKLDNTLIIEE